MKLRWGRPYCTSSHVEFEFGLFFVSSSSSWTFVRCIICEMHQVSTQENIYKYLLCCCLLHSRPLEMFVQLTSQHCCSSYICRCCLLLLQSAYAKHATGHRPGCGERSSPRHRILPRPLPPLHTQPNPCTLQQSVTGTRVQSIPSARFYYAIEL